MRNAALYNCGHTYCYDCASDFKNRDIECPNCRNKILDVIKLFN